MNLVVVARRPELAERCAATIQSLTGRHPSRTIVIQSADPDGPSWLDARIEAHCVEPRADAPETCAETIYVTCGGEAGRHLSAVATPLIIHDLPVTVWWPGEPPLASATTRDLLDAADRLVVDGSTWSGDGLGRLREMAELQDADLAGHQRFRAHAPVTLARGDRLDLRRSGLPAVPAIAAPDRRHLQHARRDRGAGLDQRGQADLSRRLAGIAARPVGGTSADTRSDGGTKAAASTRAGKTSGKPVMGRGLAATLSDGRADVAVVVRPVLSTTPPGTTLRVELLAERRGRELRADVTAEAEIVHVRVWQDGVEALDRHFRAPRRNDDGPAGRSHRGQSRRPHRVRGAPVGGRAHRRRRRATWTRREWRARATEPEIMVVADRDAGAAARRRPYRAGPGRDGRRPRAGRLGDDRRVDAGRDLPAPDRTAAGDDRALGVGPRLVGRRPVRAARPSATRTSRPSTTSCSASVDRGGHAPARRIPGVPIPVDNVHPFRTGEAIGSGRGAAWCADEMAAELARRAPAT